MIFLIGFIFVAIAFSCGFMTDRIIQTRKIMYLEKLHRAALQEQFHLAWNGGHHEALSSALTVKYKYEEYFGKQK